METIPLIILLVIISVIIYFTITIIVDISLMGALSPKISLKCKINKFTIEKENRIDIQSGYKCSAFSSAYVLRHWDISADGNELYDIMPNKMKDGYVYPKGIQNLLPKYGFKVKYCTGNINALKNEVSKGNPVIVMMRIRADKNWLHYVPIVGYDEDNIFIAESLEELVNCDEKYYNRKIKIGEFKKLWNTGMVKMPFYKNTYMTVEKI